MPYGDGSGPYGTGPVGWHRGPCAGEANGWPVWRATRVRLSPAEEREELARQEQLLARELAAVRERKAEVDNT